MNWTDIVALIACGLGGGVGVYAMINLAWASKLARLVPGSGAGRLLSFALDK